MQIDEIYNCFLQYPTIKTDNRKIVADDIFVALKGPNFNGNDYVQQALEAGAAYCITDEDVLCENNKVIAVDNCLATLQELAKIHRSTFDIPFIAITGSNGKTTTKELVHQVLSKKFRCYTTEGNLNNHIGIPLTILKIKSDAQIAVVEMGANHLLEIAGYCEYAMPTWGNITNCGKAHLEGFGSVEAIIRGKGELFDYLRENNGSIFMNADYDYLVKLSTGIHNIVSYGSANSEADYVGEAIKDNELLEVVVRKGTNFSSVKTKLVGGYNLPNVLTAISIGKTFGVEDDDIKSALESYEPSNSRSQLIHKNTNKIILDAYNANPTSMAAAIENFAGMEGENKVLVLGSMKELGADSAKEHEQIISLISNYNWSKVLVAGEGYQNVPANITHVKTSLEAAEWFRQQNFKHSQILVKGSRGMQMEKVLE